MLASPTPPSAPMPPLSPAAAPVLPPIPAADLSADQPPALEVYDLSGDVDEEEDDEDDSDDDNDDDSSDDKLIVDVSLSDDAETADGQPQPAASDVDRPAEDEAGEEEEDEEEEEEDTPEPCPRFYIRIQQFGPYVNYNTLLKRTQTKHTPPASTTAQPLSTEHTTDPLSGSATAAAAASDSVAMHADDPSDVVIVGQGRSRRKRQSLQDEYDTADPFIDDAELPQEREEDDMRTEIEGFHVQIGAVQVKEREVAVKLEGGGTADESKKRKRKEWTKRQVPMSAAMLAQVDKIVAECAALGGSDALGGSHRRLPDELVELLVQLSDIYDKDSVTRDGTERKVLRHNMLERLEPAMGQTRQAIRSRMHTAVQRHRRDQLDSQIRSLKASLQKAAAHDYSDFHHRISTPPLPTASKGNVVVHKSAEGRVQRYEYRPRFSLWMHELTELAAATLEAAGARRGEDGRAMEAEGRKLEKELWDEAAGWWGAGVMTGKVIGDRVKQARKDKRKKTAQKEHPSASTAAAATSTASSKATAPAAADKQAKGKEKEKRHREGDAASGNEGKKKKKAKTDAKTADSAQHKHKSASAKQPKESSRDKDKDGTHKRSTSTAATPASSASASSSSSAPSAVGQPVQSRLFYEPPAGAGRWSDVHFPALTAVVAVKQTAYKPSPPAPPQQLSQQR